MTLIIDEEIKQKALENKVPITLDSTLSFLCKTINENNFKQVLEIGTAVAFGSITMAENTTLKQIDTVEIDPNMFNTATENVKKHKLTNKIKLNLCDAMDYLKTCTKQYDFIYLDGPKGQYINYLPYLVNILKVGGMMIADNLFFHGMVTGKIPISKGCRAMIKGLKNYISAIKKHTQLNTTILEIGDGLGVCTKISKK